MRTETITMLRGAGAFKSGDYFGMIDGTYKVLAVPSKTTITVRRAHWWERLWLWLRRTFRRSSTYAESK